MSHRKEKPVHYWPKTRQAKTLCSLSIVQSNGRIRLDLDLSRESNDVTCKNCIRSMKSADLI